MHRRLAQWNQGEGFERARADFIARAAFVGQRIGIRLANRTLEGTFEALDANGNLMLRLDNHRAETIAAGDVFKLTRSAAKEA